MDKELQTRKNRSYKKILDTPLSVKQRRIAVSMLTAGSVQEVMADAGTCRENIQVSLGREAVGMPTAAVLLAKRAKLDKLLQFCQDIIDKDAETPLKYSDKIAAAKLYAELSGITSEKQGDTFNIGVFDLSQASEADLIRELDTIEERKRNAIDVQADML